MLIFFEKIRYLQQYRDKIPAFFTHVSKLEANGPKRSNGTTRSTKKAGSASSVLSKLQSAPAGSARSEALQTCIIQKINNLQLSAVLGEHHSKKKTKKSY